MIYIHTRLQSIPLDIVALLVFTNDQVLIRLTRFFLSGKIAPNGNSTTGAFFLLLGGGTYGLYCLFKYLRMRELSPVILNQSSALEESAMNWSLPRKSGIRSAAAILSTSFNLSALKVSFKYFSMSNEELLERFTPAFKKFNPQFERNWVKKIWVNKTNYAQPVPLVNHSKNIPAIQTPIEGLYFASMSQVYPWDRGTNFAVEIGRRAARMMLEKSQ